jgi:predicted NAD/FAD-binding protein
MIKNSKEHLPKVAIVGGGISGLTAAYALRNHAHTTLFEANQYIGGHTHTIDIEVNGKQVPVDTGFLVYNERTYPNLIQLFNELLVETVESNMSFSVCLPELNIEWAGANLNTVFAQRRNLLRPKFIRMLLDMIRFNKEATALVSSSEHTDLFESKAKMPLGDYLIEEGYSVEFRDWYLIPMAAAIWSCPSQQMLSFPLATFIQFCHNHGLLQVNNRPKWFTVKNGARHYVDKILPFIDVVLKNTPVIQVNSKNEKPVVHTEGMQHIFDYVILACHSNESLEILAGNEQQKDQLQFIKYQSNVAYLHTDTQLMPKTRNTWSSWNYMSDVLNPQPSVSVTYWSNLLQPLPVSTPIFVTLNPILMPKPKTIFQEIHYSHPVFDLLAVQAQQALNKLQGLNRIYLAGAWMKYGFHEDGHTSGLNAAHAVINHLNLTKSQSKVA